jgi:hypothetical protein
VIVQRWQAFAGGTATLEDDGGSFEEIAAGRAAPNHCPTELCEVDIS